MPKRRKNQIKKVKLFTVSFRKNWGKQIYPANEKKAEKYKPDATCWHVKEGCSVEYYICLLNGREGMHFSGKNPKINEKRAHNIAIARKLRKYFKGETIVAEMF